MDFQYNDHYSAPVDNTSLGGGSYTSFEGVSDTSFGGEHNLYPPPVDNTSFGGAPSYPSFPPLGLDQPQAGSAAQAVRTHSPSVSPGAEAAPAQAVAQSVGPARRRTCFQLTPCYCHYRLVRARCRPSSLSPVDCRFLSSTYHLGSLQPALLQIFTSINLGFSFTCLIVLVLVSATSSAIASCERRY